MMSYENVGCCDDRNVAFKGWAIGVACIYGVVTCL